MQRSYRAQLFWLPSLIFLLGLSGNASQLACADDSSNEELTRAVKAICKWRRTLNSIQLHYSWMPPNRVSSEERPARSEEDRGCWKGRWIWTDLWSSHLGPVLHLDAEHHQDGPGRRVLASRRHGYQFEWFWEKPSVVADSFRMIRVRSCGTDFPNCPPLQHLFTPSIGWAMEQFEREFPRSVGSRLVDGRKCYGLKVHNSSNLIYWVDPEYDGLPRLVEDYDAADHSWTWHCDEFRQTDSGHWFPWRGTYGSLGSSDRGWFEIHNVVFNEAVPPEAILLPPPGTRMKRTNEPKNGMRAIASPLGSWSWAVSIWPLMVTLVLAAGLSLIRNLTSLRTRLLLAVQNVIQQGGLESAECDDPESEHGFELAR